MFFDFVCLWERGERNFPLGMQKQALKISIKNTFKKFTQIFELNKNAFKIAIKNLEKQFGLFRQYKDDMYIYYNEYVTHTAEF